MKRRLADKLVLLVKAHDPAAAAAAAAAAPKGSKVSSSSAAAAAAAAGQAVWTFPTTAHKAGESIREAAERALKEAIGPSQVCKLRKATVDLHDVVGTLRLFETC
jgi:ADP-ribose pyrophosphatase YjhB (NUDIX family)